MILSEIYPVYTYANTCLQVAGTGKTQKLTKEISLCAGQVLLYIRKSVVHIRH